MNLLFPHCYAHTGRIYLIETEGSIEALQLKGHEGGGGVERVVSVMEEEEEEEERAIGRVHFIVKGGRGRRKE